MYRQQTLTQFTGLCFVSIHFANPVKVARGFTDLSSRSRTPHTPHVTTIQSRDKVTRPSMPSEQTHLSATCFSTLMRCGIHALYSTVRLVTAHTYGGFIVLSLWGHRAAGAITQSWYLEIKSARHCPIWYTWHWFWWRYLHAYYLSFVTKMVFS